MTEPPDNHTADKGKSSDRPGDKAAERLRGFLEERLPPEEVEAELQKQTNLQQDSEQESDQGENGPEERKKLEK